MKQFFKKIIIEIAAKGIARIIIEIISNSDDFFS